MLGHYVIYILVVLLQRMAAQKDWLFYYEWDQPGEQEANVQEPELP